MESALHHQRGMIDHARFPMRAPLHGVLGQGRAGMDQVTLHRGWARLCTTPGGEALGRPLDGFYEGDTLLVSSYRILVNKQVLRLAFSAQLSPSEWSAVLVDRQTIEEGNLPEGKIPDGSLDLRILRELNDGWGESLLLHNNAIIGREVELAVELGCPLADMQWSLEMKLEMNAGESRVPALDWTGGFPSHPRLRYERNFGERKNAPTAEFARLMGDKAPRDGDPVVRSLEVEVDASVTPPGSFRYDVEPGALTRVVCVFQLPPHGKGELKLRLRGRLEPKEKIRVFRGALPRRNELLPFPHTQIDTGNPTLNMILAQAAVDLPSLDLPLPGGAGHDREDLGPLFSAGIPRYSGFFCRDLLTTSWQCSLFSTRYLEKALTTLSLFRGVRYDLWRDEEPDQIPHEIRSTPNAAVGLTNREIYFGDVVSTVFWVVTLATAYHWSGDQELLIRHEETLETCISWLRRRLDEGGGFVFYAPGTPDGNRHHAWKDSGDAIVDGKGRVRVPPMAAVEVQGYAYIALMAAAELSLALRKLARARELMSAAAELKKRFNRTFWLPDEAFFALALDREHRPIDAVTSNVGHCLGCGIIDPDKRAAVVGRLLSPDLFSGWGVRTLSTENPGYDPLSYHRGSVWPVENATIAGGFRLCGFDEPGARLIEAQLATATLFPYMRLPEVISGHPRSDEYPIPGVYPDSNPLQAWSVSAIFFSMLTLLGIRPVAPLKLLLIKPFLPPWLPWVELRDLRVGRAVVDLHFWRKADGSSAWEVTRKDGDLLVLEQSAELDPEARLFHRIREAVGSVA